MSSIISTMGEKKLYVLNQDGSFMHAYDVMGIGTDKKVVRLTACSKQLPENAIRMKDEIAYIYIR